VDQLPDAVKLSYLAQAIDFLRVKMRKLPYLNGVRAFEAAARCGGFTRAGAELHVTPAAVSRMVKLLEARLGIGLFERGANRLTLTPAGQAYQVGLGPILDALSLLTEQIQRASRDLSSNKILTIGVGPTFAVRWLIPRLASFGEFAPQIEVRITTGGIAAPFGDDWTCGIKLGNGVWPGLVAEQLFEADLIPVCAPQFAKRLKSHRTLPERSLLRVAHAPADWPKWLKSVDAGGITAKGPIFEFYGQALQAAADGLGIALGIRPYIDDDLESGRIVTPFCQSVSKGSRWYLIFRASNQDDLALQMFRKWVKQVITVREPMG
jgi:LysR family glycine cleavage system transcriptional activator